MSISCCDGATSWWWSSSAPSSSEGVIAKLFRCPSMSVNQKRTYSTPSFFASSSTALRAFGSDVARSLLSIIAMVVSLLVAGRPTLSTEQWTGHMHPFEARLVAQLPVHAQHWRVAEVVLRAQVPPARRAGGRRLMPLERESDPASACGARDPRHPVLRGVGGVAAEQGVADGVPILERDEREVAEHELRP